MANKAVFSALFVFLFFPFVAGGTSVGDVDLQLNLNKGWNLVSNSIFANYDERASTCVKGDLPSVWRFSKSLSQYVPYVFTAVYNDPFLEDVCIPGTVQGTGCSGDETKAALWARERAAYAANLKSGQHSLLYATSNGASWVYSKKTCSFVSRFVNYSVSLEAPYPSGQLSGFEGSHSSGFSRHPRGVQIFSGWNFVSVLPWMLGKTFEEIKGSCSFVSVYSWDAGAQVWVKLLSPYRAFDILSESFLMKVADGCYFDYAVVKPPAFPED